ncbi:MAG: metallophosphoesterase family protein [Rhodospirillaceae bacterium]|nr:metallophosphoesterase family protein [Rhodospirillaceae bacterium]
MKLGIVSDLHCNIKGLDRALELMGEVDQILCLGDTIYEYRFSNEVISRLIEIGAHTIQGNHEETFLGPMGARARAREGIDPDLMHWLSEQPHRMELECDGKTVLMVHSTPWEPRGTYVYRHSPELERFGEADAHFVLFGHTHQQVVHRAGDLLVVNPGSAGDARDPDNGRLLSCAILDTVTEDAQIIDFPDPARE